jgi:BirA family biotin operon repressor/biotin-[acetyl-CoA-carboxylase] ligase
MPDAFLDADTIRASTFIRHVELHETLGSTNDRAAELARDADVDLPALVAARHQTAGRGRGDHKWFASEGALTFSVLLEPKTFHIELADWPKLALTTGVATCDALASEVGRAPPAKIDSTTAVGNAPTARPNPQSAIPGTLWVPQSQTRLAIKWPNDIILDGAKLAGILIESPGGSAPAKDRLVIGIGINVNNTWRTPDVAARGLARHRATPANAITLFDVTGYEHSTQHILINILRAFETRIAQLAARDPQLPAAWQRLCWLTEQGVEVQASTVPIEGICVGIDRDGALLVEDALRTHRIHSGSVRAI